MGAWSAAAVWLRGSLCGFHGIVNDFLTRLALLFGEWFLLGRLELRFLRFLAPFSCLVVVFIFFVVDGHSFAFARFGAPFRVSIDLLLYQDYGWHTILQLSLCRDSFSPDVGFDLVIERLDESFHVDWIQLSFGFSSALEGICWTVGGIDFLMLSISVEFSAADWV